MKELSIDIETYSEEDIESGVHKYVEHDSFEILLVAYKIDDGEEQLIDLASGDKMPKQFLTWLQDDSIVKCAYNAAFERICFQKYFGVKLSPENWKCTMVTAAMAGYPFGLDMVAKVMKTQDQKDSKGKELIRYFCEPCKPTKSNKGRTRNMYFHDFDKWLDFRSYCVQDVATEYAIRKKLEWFNICDFEKPVYALDQKINDTGVKVEMTLVNNAIRMNELFTEEKMQYLRDITNLENPSSVAQLKKYIFDKTGLEVSSLSKETMDSLFHQFKDNDEITDVLKVKQMISRSSIKKFNSIQNSACSDHRVKGLFQYYGANRTGRFSGRRVQLQNLKRNDLKDLKIARDIVLRGEKSVLELTYDDVGHVLSNLIRTAFIPENGKKLFISDLASIEARITAWFADESWRLKIFNTHGRIYEASASQMFNVPIDSITYDENGHTKKGPNYEMRAKGKVAELALGYQGGVGALERMGGAAMGLSVKEMQRIVDLWRKSSPRVVRLWYDLQECAERALKGERCRLPHDIVFYKLNGNMIIQLPSGRQLVYINARFGKNRFDSVSIQYEGLDQVTGKWCMQETYGGKLLENIVQATARDVLVDIMKRLDKKGFNIIMHVHDEIVCEESEDREKEMTQTMTEPIHWAKGLPLGAETFSAFYYQK